MLVSLQAVTEMDWQPEDGAAIGHNTPFSPSTAKVLEANVLLPSNPSEEPLSSQGLLFERPCSSGGGPTTDFKWIPHEKQKMNFIGNRKGPACATYEGSSSIADLSTDVDHG